MNSKWITHSNPDSVDFFAIFLMWLSVVFLTVTAQMTDDRWQFSEFETRKSISIIYIIIYIILIYHQIWIFKNCHLSSVIVNLFRKRHNFVTLLQCYIVTIRCFRRVPLFCDMSQVTCHTFILKVYTIYLYMHYYHVEKCLL